VQLVTGDTKVVDKGKGDGIFINTAGIGVVEVHVSISPKERAAGDAILLSGDIGRHGICDHGNPGRVVIRKRDRVGLCPIVGASQGTAGRGVKIHCLRDLTRGGLSSG